MAALTAKGRRRINGSRDWPLRLISTVPTAIPSTSFSRCFGRAPRLVSSCPRFRDCSGWFAHLGSFG